MPINRYRYTESALDSPATGAFAVTPDDDTDLTELPRALYIGTEGDVAVILDGITLTFVAASGILPIRPSRVMDTNTTATDIIALV